MTDAPSWDLAGPEGAPLIVFVHGSRLSRGSWGWVMDQLKADYRCLAIDLPGHGVLATEAFALDDAADRIIRAVDGLGERRAVLVGLSLGGYVAMAAAARHPDRVRGLVIAGATAEPAGPARHAFRAFAWALAAMPLRPFERFNTWFFRRRYPAGVAEPIVRGGYWTRGGAAAVRQLISPSGASTSFRDRLLAYGGPILVINGELDLLFRLGARSFLRGVPGVRRRLLRRTTHLSPFDSPREFAAAVRAFVASLPD